MLVVEGHPTTLAGSVMRFPLHELVQRGVVWHRSRDITMLLWIPLRSTLVPRALLGWPLLCFDAFLRLEVSELIVLLGSNLILRIWRPLRHARLRKVSRDVKTGRMVEQDLLRSSCRHLLVDVVEQVLILLGDWVSGRHTGGGD